MEIPTWIMAIMSIISVIISTLALKRASTAINKIDQIKNNMPYNKGIGIQGNVIQGNGKGGINIEK